MPLTKVGKEGITGISNSSDATAISIDSSEKLGLGTSSPDEILHLKTTADADLGLKVENDDTQAFVKVQSGGTALYGGNGGVNFVSGGSFATAMNIDANGHVTKPLHPAFKAGLNTNTTFGAGATVVFNHTASSSTHFNRGNHYSTSTGKFTAPVDGIYFFGVSMIFMSMGDGDAMHDSFYIHKNTSTLICYSHRRAEYVNGSTGNSGYFTDFAHVTTELSANDTVEVNTRENKTVHGNTNYSYFHGYFIG